MTFDCFVFFFFYLFRSTQSRFLPLFFRRRFYSRKYLHLETNETVNYILQRFFFCLSLTLFNFIFLVRHNFCSVFIFTRVRAPQLMFAVRFTFSSICLYLLQYVLLLIDGVMRRVNGFSFHIISSCVRIALTQ